MNIRQLREELRYYDDEAKVLVSTNGVSVEASEIVILKREVKEKDGSYWEEQSVMIC